MAATQSVGRIVGTWTRQGYGSRLPGRAAQELETAIAKGLPVEMRLQAMDSLSHIYADLEISTRHEDSSNAGYLQAPAMPRHRHGGNTPGSCSTALEILTDRSLLPEKQPGSATRIRQFRLAQALLVKAGSLYRTGSPQLPQSWCRKRKVRCLAWRMAILDSRDCGGHFLRLRAA
jgi:hypothetical protein